jgi:hypothetical protein
VRVDGSPGTGQKVPNRYNMAMRRTAVEPTSIHIPQPRPRPPRPEVVVVPVRGRQSDVSALDVVSPPPAHPLVRAAERVNQFGCEWWFVGLLVSVFAAMVGRGLCG